MVGWSLSPGRTGARSTWRRRCCPQRKAERANRYGVVLNGPYFTPLTKVFKEWAVCAQTPGWKLSLCDITKYADAPLQPGGGSVCVYLFHPEERHASEQRVRPRLVLPANPLQLQLVRYLLQASLHQHSQELKHKTTTLRFFQQMDESNY